MKTLKSFASILFLLLILFGQYSCMVLYKEEPQKPQKHRGWNKNPNNPHHPNTTNPGHNKKPKKQQ